MQFWEILVPTVRNDGRPIKTKFHRVWDKKVRKLTGGLTILQPAKGQWASPDGILFTERMIPVRIATTKDQMELIADFTARYYEQHAILYYKISDDVNIVHYDCKKKFERK
jgi:hypothetical protein